VIDCDAVPSPTVECSGEMITATFSRRVNRLLDAQYLSVASDYNEPAINCSSYTTSHHNSHLVSIAVPFVGGGCNTTRQVHSQ